MTSSGANHPRTVVASPGMLTLVRRRVLRRWGARLGTVWLIAMVILAVFAPVIANSHPLAMRVGGQWSSPAMEHLTPVDVILFVGTVVGVVLWMLSRIRSGVRWWVWATVVVVTAGVAFTLVRPPQVVVYSKYREAAASGWIESMIPAPIPFSPVDRLRDAQEDVRFRSPSLGQHWMGTTAYGEDLASRMIHATRIALAVGFIATGIAVVIGVVVGGLMGYFSGWVDLIGMRVVEVFSAIPTIFLLIAFVAFYGRNLYLMMVIIGLTGWVGYALFVRAEFLKLRRMDYVQAARACGLPLRSILFRHILPNGLAPVLVNASFGVAAAILTESVLSFLGLGLVDEPSWGQMLSQAQVAGVFRWWIVLYPGLAIFLTVLAYNFIGEALRDAIDPRLDVSTD